MPGGWSLQGDVGRGPLRLDWGDISADDLSLGVLIAEVTADYQCCYVNGRMRRDSHRPSSSSGPDVEYFLNSQSQVSLRSLVARDHVKVADIELIWQRRKVQLVIQS